MPTLPNLLVIGAGKCGTTSLHYYLGLHPQISMSYVKELNFFVKEHKWRRGVKWYQSNFSGSARIYGETSPAYTNYPVFSGVPERIYSTLPLAKLIYLVRDPLKRIFSHYIQCYANRKEDRPFQVALQNFKSNPYVT